MSLLQYIKLFFSKKLDTIKDPNTITQSIPDPIAITAGQVSVGFSKAQGSGELILKLINDSKVSIHMAAYGFDHPQIVEALIQAHLRGVDVKIVVDRSDALNSSRSGLKESATAFIPIRVNSHYAIMHNKFLIVDAETVEMGSFNYTQNAQCHNAENVFIIYNQPAVALKYETYWQQLWNESIDYVI